MQVGEYREGLVLSEQKEGLAVDIGVQQPALLRQKQYAVGERLTLQVINVSGSVEVQPANREDIPVYWGYRVQVEKRSFGQISKDKGFDLKIATAKIGDSFMAVEGRIADKWSGSDRVLVGFGAPSRGLHEIVEDEHLKLNDLADFVVNTVPNQGTVTVRTEEALLATLAILNLNLIY